MCDTGSVFKAQIQIPSAVYKPQMSSYTLPIRRDFALQILAGKKTFEGRKSANVKHLEEGQVLSFHWYHSTRVQCEVMSVQRFESPHAMVEACGHHALIPSSESAEQCTVSWQLVFCLLLSSFVSFLQTFSSLFFRLSAHCFSDSRLCTARCMAKTQLWLQLSSEIQLWWKMCSRKTAGKDLRQQTQTSRRPFTVDVHCSQMYVLIGGAPAAAAWMRSFTLESVTMARTIELWHLFKMVAAVLGA